MREKRTIEQLHRGHSKAVNNLRTSGAALLVSSILLIIFLSLLMRNELVRDATVQARTVAANSNAILMFGDEKAAREILSSLAASPTIDYAAIISADGAELAHYRSVRYVASSQPDLPRQEGHRFTFDYLDVAEEVSQGQERIGSVVLRYGLAQFYQRLLSIAGLILVVAIGALLIVHFFVSRMRVAVSRAELHLEYLAFFDPVTNLPNRRGFLGKLDEALAIANEESGEVGLILMDLDNFKVVNDTMGHACGDEILRLVAQRLTASSRSTDTVCRTGGDEFVIIMRQRDSSAIDLEGIAKRVMGIMAQPYRYHEQEFFLTASVGSSMYPRDANDSQTLIRKADTAMYAAKVQGKNAFAVFRPEMDHRVQRRLTLDGSLRKSLEKEQLRLHYQPQIDLKNGKIVGVEALLRWTHPELGMISPAEFIPVAEETGLIVELGKWVLNTACKQLADWRDSGIRPIRMAVNLSARQMRDQALMSDIGAVLAKTGISPLLLELEITEGILMENVQTNIRMLQNFQSAGINLSIDDFGTGYSSLSYLKRFPINQLKIDRSFVNDIPGEGEAFVTAIVSMAHSLGLAVVAEGVETEEQGHFLKEAGCDFAQGYYFARPMPAAEMIAMLQEGYIRRS